jgi:hypothetical protein
MRNKSYIWLGHFLLLARIITICLVVVSYGDFSWKNLKFFLMISLWMTALRTYLIEPALSTLEKKRHFIEQMCTSRYSAFKAGCLIGVLDIIIMLIFGAGTYFFYKVVFMSEETSTFWQWVFFIFFSFGSLAVTVTLTFLIRQKRVNSLTTRSSDD